MRRAKDGKAVKDVGKVLEARESRRIIEVGGGEGRRTGAVVTKITSRTTASGAAAEVVIEDRHNGVKDQRSKDGGKGVTLNEALTLGKGAPVLGVVEVPDGVLTAVDKVEEREQMTEAIVFCEDFTARGTGDGIEHVFDVKEEETASGRGTMRLGGGNVAVDKRRDGVNNEIEATRDTNSILAGRDKEGCKVVGEVGHAERTNNASPAGANANRAKFRGNGGVFVQSCKVGCAEGVGGLGRDVARDQEVGKADKSRGIGHGSRRVGTGRVGPLIGGVSADDIGIISEGPGCSAFTDRSQSAERVGGVKDKGRDSRRLRAGVRAMGGVCVGERGRV